MLILLEILSTLSAALFAGAATYINLVEHPARIECGADLALTEFGASYRKGAVVMGSLLMLGFLSGTAAWLISVYIWWLIGAVLLLTLIPYTLILIFPISKRLLNSSLESNSSIGLSLLIRWGKLHTVRTLLGLTALLIFIFSLAHSSPR
jgi:hypothetical protein